MTSNVHVSLLPGPGLGERATVPVGGLGSLLKPLMPNRILAKFKRRENGTTAVGLYIEFQHAQSAELVKHALVRIEGEADFEVAFLPLESADGTDDVCYLNVVPETATLPSGKDIAVSLPLVGIMQELFNQAAMHSADFIYQIDFRRSEADPVLAKTLIPALAEVRENYGKIGGLDDALSRSFELIRNPGWQAFESFGLKTQDLPRNSGWVESTLSTELAKLAPFLPKDLTTMSWKPENEPAVNCTFQEQVSVLRDDEYLDIVFNAMDVGNSGNNVYTNLINPVGRSISSGSIAGEFAFISYAHKNKNFVSSLVQGLNNSGVRCWIDDGISPGSHWDEQLENRLRSCGVLIACVSDEYQSSKYCRRELKFADLLNKNIIPVSETEWYWGEGLQMMFQELQISKLDREGEFGAILGTLSSVAPQIFRS